MDQERIILKPITEADTENIVKWRNSENVRKNFIFQGDFSNESHLAWLNNHVKTGNAIQFIIIEKCSNLPIGSVFIKDIDQTHKKAEYGIFIGEDSARGKGYGTLAAQQMIHYAFSTEKLHKLYLRVYESNAQAIASYKKAGFEVEGVLRDEVFVRGEFRNLVWMSIINPDC